jgi:hypothetical protein
VTVNPQKENPMNTHLQPSTAKDRAEFYLARERAIRLCRKHLRAARDMLWGGRAGEHAERYIDPKEVTLNFSYQSLLDEMLDAAETIIERLPDDYFEISPAGESIFGWVGAYNLSDDTVERVEKISAALTSRRKTASKAARIAKLEAVDGRTPEEAAMYLSKAAELRERA